MPLRSIQMHVGHSGAGEAREPGVHTHSGGYMVADCQRSRTAHAAASEIGEEGNHAAVPGDVRSHCRQGGRGRIHGSMSPSPSSEPFNDSEPVAPERLSTLAEPGVSWP